MSFSVCSPPLFTCNNNYYVVLGPARESRMAPTKFWYRTQLQTLQEQATEALLQPDPTFSPWKNGTFAWVLEFSAAGMLATLMDVSRTTQVHGTVCSLERVRACLSMVLRWSGRLRLRCFLAGWRSREEMGHSSLGH